MATYLAGYSWLIQKYSLAARQQSITATIDSSVNGRVRHTHGRQVSLRFAPVYRPDDALVPQLQFAFRYEGINLEVLALLFQANGADELNTWLRGSPESAYARRACFLYEWLTGNANVITAKAAPRSKYVALVDSKLQYCVQRGEEETKFRIHNNLPGNRNFCPMVRREDQIDRMIGKNLSERARTVLDQYDPDLVRRAAQYLYLAETHSSFEIEREHPSSSKAQRFATLLQEADANLPLSEDRLLDLQHAVVDTHIPEFSYRTTQNWIGTDTGTRRVVSYVPPRPEHVRNLMDGLVATHERWRRDPKSFDAVIHAAMISFGFVFIHPFLDGNGRLHRYLIHETLSAAGFTPRGIIFPVSAAILDRKADYVETLEDFSGPVLQLTSFTAPPAGSPPEMAKAAGNEPIYYQFFDATEQVSYLYHAIERTIENDLQSEIDYLLAFDRAHSQINAIADFPGQTLDLLINLIRQNGGTLSKTKRQSHFPNLTDDALLEYEEIVRTSFRTRGKGEEH